MNPIAKRTISALTTAALVVVAILYAPSSVLVTAFGVLYLLALFELWQLVARKGFRLLPTGLAVFLAGALVLALPFSALPAVAVSRGSLWMLYLIAIVKISDMGGFAFGVSFGKHKLCPSISPNKSWEGLFGSIFASCVVSCAFMAMTHFGWGKALAFGVVAALVGTAGDLVESKFKRWVGVKDSATFMPAGMGGLLDMFDSLTFAPAVLLAFL